MRAFLKIETKVANQFQGDSQDHNHRGWIDELDWWMEAPVDRGSLRRGKSEFTDDEFSFVKPMDRSSVALFEAVESVLLDRVVLHADNGEITSSMWCEFHDAVVVRSRKDPARPWRSRMDPAVHCQWTFDKEIETFTMLFKSVDYHVGTPLLRPAFGAAVARGITAGVTARAIHMLRHHQGRSKKQ